MLQGIIENGQTALGIEFGSTRIKAVLIGLDGEPLASGAHEWENQFKDGYWTYSLDMIIEGLQNCYRELKKEVKGKYGVTIEKIGAVGISAMMHGYLAFDGEDNLLVPFRTWRNTTTEKAAAELSELFSFNIPQRWSIAHLYQAILNGEEHVKDVKFVATLAAYVHYLLTGKKVIGIGDASGMFPIDSNINDYDKDMLSKFEKLTGIDITDIFPEVLVAGENAGMLTDAGAKLLDPEGDLLPSVPVCPPEGDAGTGMTATNSVATLTGNVSAGTSIFAMVVLQKALSKNYEAIDMVTTPDGKPVAMVHCNNFTSDIDAWVKLFAEVLTTMGADFKKYELYDKLYAMALEGDPSCDGLVAYNYYAGEPITGLEEGRPMFARMPSSKMSLANVMRTLVFSAMGTLKIGMNILTEEEKIEIKSLLGHGGFFKTKDICQSLMASALNVPVSVMESAGEGGAWGIALLAAYMLNPKDTLEKYLEAEIFKGNKGSTIAPTEADKIGFDGFMKNYVSALEAEKALTKTLK